MKYVCFDIGNVLCKVSFESFKKSVSKTLNIPTTDVDYFLNRTQCLHDLVLTNVGDELRDHFKIKSSAIIDELLVEWNHTIVIDKLMLQFISQLNDDGIKIALLSNMGFEHREIIKQLLGETLYNNCINFFSCEVGARKPNLIYYKTFLDLHKEFTNALYIDDRPENIVAGMKFGFNSIRFALDDLHNETDKIAAIEELKKVILT